MERANCPRLVQSLCSIVCSNKYVDLYKQWLKVVGALWYEQIIEFRTRLFLDSHSQLRDSQIICDIDVLFHHIPPVLFEIGASCVKQHRVWWEVTGCSPCNWFYGLSRGQRSSKNSVLSTMGQHYCAYMTEPRVGPCVLIATSSPAVQARRAGRWCR